MNNFNDINPDVLKSLSIDIHEPFAEFLMAGHDEYIFKISLLDVIHFAGHACPSIVGAFLVSQKAVRELFPETNICIRGQVAIEITNPCLKFLSSLCLILYLIFLCLRH